MLIDLEYAIAKSIAKLTTMQKTILRNQYLPLISLKHNLVLTPQDLSDIAQELAPFVRLWLDKQNIGVLQIYRAINHDQHNKEIRYLLAQILAEKGIDQTKTYSAFSITKLPIGLQKKSQYNYTSEFIDITSIKEIDLDEQYTKLSEYLTNKEHPGNAKNQYALHFFGQCCIRLSFFDKALRAFLDIKKYYSKDPRILCYALTGIGDLYRAQRNFPQALNHYKQATEVDDWNRYALFRMGEGLMKSHQYLQAIPYLQKYLERADVLMDTRIDLAEQYLNICLKNTNPNYLEK
jgi:tetratricopeptide (TPR) repeat protein